MSLLESVLVDLWKTGKTIASLPSKHLLSFVVNPEEQFHNNYITYLPLISIVADVTPRG